MKSILPLRSAIIEILNDRNGELIDTDLTQALKTKYGFNRSSEELNRNLLALETQGLIHVQILPKQKKLIKMISEETHTYMGVEED